jgi:hypothetical protein
VEESYPNPIAFPGGVEVCTFTWESRAEDLVHHLERERMNPTFEFLAGRDKPLRIASVREVFLAEPSAKSGQWEKEAAGKEVR